MAFIKYVPGKVIEVTENRPEKTKPDEDKLKEEDTDKEDIKNGK